MRSMGYGYIGIRPSFVALILMLVPLVDLILADGITDLNIPG